MDLAKINVLMLVVKNKAKKSKKKELVNSLWLIGKNKINNRLLIMLLERNQEIPHPKAHNL